MKRRIFQMLIYGINFNDFLSLPSPFLPYKIQLFIQNIPSKHKFIPLHKYLDAGYTYIIDHPKSINLQFTVHTHTYISPRLNFCKSKLIKQTLHYALLITRIVKILINNTTIRTHSRKEETRSIRL